MQLDKYHLAELTTRPNQSAPMEIIYSSKLNDTNSPTTNCLSPSSLASQFSQSIGFSSTSSSLNDFNSHSSVRAVLPNQNLIKTTTVPLTSSLPTPNLIFSLTKTPKNFEFFQHHHPQQDQRQRQDQQTIVETSHNSSSTKTTATTHVLCR